MEENLCRFCFKVMKNESQAVDGATKQMLQVLRLNVVKDSDASENLSLCEDCAEIIKKSFYFKTVCMETEQFIRSFSTKTKKLDIKDIYQCRKDVKIVPGEDFNVCLFCMNQIVGNNFASMNVSSKNEFYAKTSTIFISKTVLDIIEDPVICTSCTENLDRYFKFIRNRFDIEEEIIKFRQSEGTTSNLVYSDESLKRAIKQESICEDGQGSADCEIKNETLDIKDEESSCEEIDNNDKPNRRRIVSKETYKCNKCTYESKFKDYFRRHVLLVHASELGTLTCGVCTYKTRYKKCLDKHTLAHEDANVETYKCGICIYETYIRSNLRRHALVHKDRSEAKIYKCGRCAFETKHRSCIKNHELIHKSGADVTMYRCETCGFETKYKHCLGNHSLTHEDASKVEMYKCARCTFESKYKRALKKHVLMHASALVKTYKCGICTYETKLKNSLDAHLLVHKDGTCIGLYKCGTCGFRTKYKGNLKIHMQTHKRNKFMRLGDGI